MEALSVFLNSQQEISRSGKRQEVLSEVFWAKIFQSPTLEDVGTEKLSLWPCDRVIWLEASICTMFHWSDCILSTIDIGWHWVSVGPFLNLGVPKFQIPPSFSSAWFSPIPLIHYTPAWVTPWHQPQDLTLPIGKQKGMNNCPERTKAFRSIKNTLWRALFQCQIDMLFP